MEWRRKRATVEKRGVKEEQIHRGSPQYARDLRDETKKMTERGGALLQILNSGPDFKLGEKDYNSLIVSQSAGGEISLWHDRAALPLSPPPRTLPQEPRTNWSAGISVCT